MPPSIDRDPSCLHSLSPNSKPLALLFQHQSSQVTVCALGWQMKSYHISHGSLWDIDWAIISGSASSSFSPDGRGSSSSPTRQTDFFCVYFCLCTGAMTLAQVGFLVQLQGLSPGLEQPQHLPSVLPLFPQGFCTTSSSVW